MTSAWWCDLIDRLYPVGSFALDLGAPHWARTDEIRAAARVGAFIFEYAHACNRTVTYPPERYDYELARRCIEQDVGWYLEGAIDADELARFLHVPVKIRLNRERAERATVAASLS